MGTKNKSKSCSVVVKLDDGNEFLVEIRVSPLTERS